MHLHDLKRKTPAELVAMAEELGVENASTLRKQDILFSILKALADNGTQIMGSGTIEVPERRSVLFQDSRLLPWASVLDNVVLGSFDAEARERARVALREVGLAGHEEKWPKALSGGEQQRVALARALAPRPRVLLLDEPLSALDAKIRVSLRNQIREIQQQLGITTIFVTHDQEEALSISDRIVVMHKGIADQTGSPSDIYNSPATDFVAGFVGTLNRLEAEVVDAASGHVRIAGAGILLGRAVPQGKVVLAARPESLQIAAEGIPAEITGVEFLGSVQRLRARVEGAEVVLDRFNTPGDELPRPGVKIHLSAPRTSWLVLPQ